MKIETAYDIGDLVLIDRCKEIIAVITQISFRSDRDVAYRCNWFSNGTQQDVYIEEWRLSIWDE